MLSYNPFFKVHEFQVGMQMQTLAVIGGLPHASTEKTRLPLVSISRTLVLS